MKIDHDAEHLINAYSPPEFSEAYFIALENGESYFMAEICGWYMLIRPTAGEG